MIFFNTKCTTLNLIPKYVIVTNATLGSDRDWQWLLDNNFQLNLSIDGPRDIKNRNRPLASHLQSFDIIDNRLKWLNEKGAHIHIRSTVLAAEEVSRICTIFQNYPCVVSHALEPVSISGRAAQSDIGVEIGTFYGDFFRAYSQWLYEAPERFKSSWFKPFKRTEGFCGAVYCNNIVLPSSVISLCSEVDEKIGNQKMLSSFLVSNVHSEGDVLSHLMLLGSQIEML